MYLYEGRGLCVYVVETWKVNKEIKGHGVRDLFVKSKCFHVNTNIRVSLRL